MTSLLSASRTLIHLQLGEWEEQEVKLFLIKWCGWRFPYWTWEPLPSLIEGKEETLHQWQQRSMQQRREKNEPFDVATWEADRREFLTRKNVKRARHGKPPVRFYASESGDVSDDEYLDDDHQLHSDPQPRPQARAKPKRADSSDEDRPLIDKQRVSIDLSDDDMPLSKRRRISEDAAAAKCSSSERTLVQRTNSMPVKKATPSVNDKGSIKMKRTNTVNPYATLASAKGTHKGTYIFKLLLC